MTLRRMSPHCNKLEIEQSGHVCGGENIVQSLPRPAPSRGRTLAFIEFSYYQRHPCREHSSNSHLWHTVTSYLDRGAR